MDYEYIDTAQRLNEAVRELRHEPLLGVDTEAAGYHRYHDRISLIQISTRDANLLIDPVAIDDLSALAPLFSDATTEKIFHDADFDLRILDRDLGLRVKGLFDSQIAAAFLGERALGLGAVVEKYVGVKLPKGFQRADWAERPLSDGMKEYAVMDTAYLPTLRDRLREELERRGRLAWAEEEFRRREETRWAEAEDSGEAYLRVKGARDLSPRGLAILREVFAWRDAVARERDLASFRVLSNQAMIELGLRAPRNAAELRTVQGISDGLVDRRGNEMLAAVRRGLEVPEDELPSFPRAPRWERDPTAEERSERLREVRNRVAGQLELDPGFLISRSLLDEIARRQPTSSEDLLEIADVRRWQVEALGEVFQQALAGDGGPGSKP